MSTSTDNARESYRDKTNGQFGNQPHAEAEAELGSPFAFSVSEEHLQQFIEDYDLDYGNAEVLDNGGVLYITVEAPNHATMGIRLDGCEDMRSVRKSVAEFMEDFDADEEFEELWSNEFRAMNHYSPTQFLEMLKSDEKFFKKTGKNIRKQLREEERGTHNDISEIVSSSELRTGDVVDIRPVLDRMARDHLVKQEDLDDDSFYQQAEFEYLIVDQVTVNESEVLLISDGGGNWAIPKGYDVPVVDRVNPLYAKINDSLQEGRVYHTSTAAVGEVVSWISTKGDLPGDYDTLNIVEECFDFDRGNYVPKVNPAQAEIILEKYKRG